MDAPNEVIHSVAVTPANTAASKVIQAKAPGAKDFTNLKCKWKGFVDEGIKARNRWKSKIQSRVEHSIGVIKRVSPPSSAGLPSLKVFPYQCVRKCPAQGIAPKAATAIARDSTKALCVPTIENKHSDPVFDGSGDRLSGIHYICNYLKRRLEQNSCGWACVNANRSGSPADR